MPSSETKTMRLLAISDTRGDVGAARKAILDKGPWDFIIHLGDSMLDAVDLAAELGLDIVALRGPGDFEGAPNLKDVLVFEMGGVRFRATHGDELEQEGGGGQALEKLAERARRAEASVALFGHTRVPLVRQVGDVLVVNPGGMSGQDSRRSYAEIIVENEAARARILEI